MPAAEGDVMKLDLRPLLAEEIRVLSVDFSLDPPVEDNENPMSNLYGVGFPAPLHVCGEITNTAGYMRMALEASVPYTATCARCLQPVSDTFSFRFEKTVAPAKQVENTPEEDKDDYAVIYDGFLDVDEQLLEMLELEFPSKLLCREDCAGLCPTCGKDLNDGPCGCDAKKEDDPRLAPLRDLLKRYQSDDAAGDDKGSEKSK